MTPLINTKNVSIYFGNASDNVRMQGEYADEKFLALQQKISAKIKQNIDHLFFLKQTHSVDVFVLSDTYALKTLTLFQHEGDAIITKEKNVAIGVVTADCLPVILYDKKNNAIGVIHAGWRGLSAKIITATIIKMRDAFGTQPLHLSAYCGPSAGVCCYEVQPDFLSYFPGNSVEKNIFEKQGGKLFFNQQRAALNELLDNELLPAEMNVENNVCTICTPGFCSVRNEKEDAGRQPSIAVLF